MACARITILRAAAAAALLLAVPACGDDASNDGGGTDGGGGDRGGSACMRGCEATLAADCSQGPGSRAECESDCERLRTGECGAEYRTFMSCAEGQDVSCSAGGLPAVEACEVEQNDFVACLN